MAAKNSRARAKKRLKNKELSEALISWAQKYGVESDSFVSALAKALAERKNLAMWATLSPLEYLPVPNISVNSKRFVNVITLIRNTLIFAPVALTWSAVGKATSAFGQFVKQNEGSVVNFLQFWQDGYGMLGASWRLGHIAFLDFLIISFVIVLIIYLHFANIRIDKERATKEAVMENERMAIAVEINRFLFEKRAITKETRRDEFANATQDLVATTSSLKNLVKNFEKAAKDGPTSKKILNELTKMNKQQDRFGSISRDFKF